jgi:hypothetical protein
LGRIPWYHKWHHRRWQRCSQAPPSCSRSLQVELCRQPMHFSHHHQSRMLQDHRPQRR